MSDSTYYVQASTMQGIANAVRDLTHTTCAMTPTQIQSKIASSKLGIPIHITKHINDATGEWVRPSDYPNLDSLTIGIDFDGLYLTYDLRKVEDICTPWIGVYVNTTNAGSFYVERGHILNNEFVVDETHTVSRGTHYRQSLDVANGNVQLWRVWSDKNITRFGFSANSATASDNFLNTMQPCVEKVGRLDWLSSFASYNASGVSDVSWVTSWLEREKVACAGKSNVTSLYATWNVAYSLQSLDLSEWNTSGWEVTTLYCTWGNCWSLRTLDLSSFDTSKWAVNTLQSTWANCFALETLIVDEWDTSNWAVTTMRQAWEQCYCLKSLDLNGWDTKNWIVNTTYYTFRACYCLERLEIGDWDVSNWAVTTMNNMFGTCYSLKELKLNKWDVSNWAVANIGSTFGYLYSLKTLEIGDWDVSNWAVTTMNSLFACCESLESLDLSKWNVSNWAVTDLYYAFYQMFSLTELKINTWNTSNWAVTDMRYLFGGSYSLKVLDIRNWDMSGWTGNDITNTINTRAQEIYLPPSYPPTNDYNNKWYQNVVYFMKTNGIPFKYSHSYSEAKFLDHDSLVAIISKLPTVTSETLTLGKYNKLKLTPAEIAVATQKGWTVA